MALKNFLVAQYRDCRRILMRYLLLCFLLLLIAAPTAAEGDAAWSAWIYSAADTYTRVYSDGRTHTITLNLPDGYKAHAIRPSNDGDLLAFCAWDSDQVHALIYDTNTEGIRYDYWLGSPDGCLTILDESNTRMAIVLSYDSTQPLDFPWRMVVVDSRNSEVTTQISSTDHEAGGRSWVIGPNLETFEGDTVTFTAASNVGDGPSTETYHWSLSRNVIEEVRTPVPYYIDYLPATDEYLWWSVDDALPYEQFEGMGIPFNVVQAFGSDGIPINIFHSPYKFIWETEFIDDGQKIAIAISGEPTSHWVYIDREGRQARMPYDVPVYPSYTKTWGTSDGFVFVRATSDNYHRLIHYRFQGDQLERRVLWWAPILDNFYARLIWVTPMQGAADLAPLADMEMVTLNEPKPSPTPIPPTPTEPPGGYG
jgi:hypothetical protein